MASTTPSLITTVRSNLAKHPHPDLTEFNKLEKKNRAAVLIALVCDEAKDSVHILLSRRALSLRTHAGEVAFPGGRMDEIDRDAPETAIREAHEEIGLLPDSLKVASIHEPGVSLHRLLVAPVSAFIDLSLLEFAVVNPSVSIAANLVRHLPVNPDEVESVFAIPLQEFLKRENHEELHFDADDGSGGVWKAHKFDVVDEWGREYKVWGLTAHILVEFARIALGRDPEFPLISNAQRPKILNRADRSTRRG